MNNSFESTGSKAGRPKIANQWTRVVRIKHAGQTKFSIYDIGGDLLLDNALPVVPRKDRMN